MATVATVAQVATVPSAPYLLLHQSLLPQMVIYYRLYVPAETLGDDLG